MSDLKQLFKQAGGTTLLKQYWRTWTLFPALVQFCLLGRSKKSLELLRNIVTLKIQKRLKRKYSRVLIDFRYDVSLEKQTSKYVWVFWWQGIENAPLLVQRCFQSVKDNLSDWELVLITKDNYMQYVHFPEQILKKHAEGVITLTHLSDLLRLELLINHGGLWLDATVLCTSGDIPKSIVNSELFVYQAQKPGADGKATIMSSWCMYAKTNNKLLMATRALLYEYWKKNDKMDDYFLLHQFFTIVCDKYQEEARKIPPFCNSVPHILLLHLFDNFNENYWNDLKRMTCFHKLSYKLDNKKTKLPDTYYQYIINNSTFI